MKDNFKNTKQKIVNKFQGNIDKDYILRLKSCQDWDSGLRIRPSRL